MATRSHIAIKNLDGTLQSIYCHFDGNLGGVGYTLFTFYKTENKIRKLISGGGISGLGYNLNDTSFYKDRGEEIKIDNFSSEEFGDFKNFIQKLKFKTGIEFFYFFNVYVKKWYFVDTLKEFIEIDLLGNFI